MNCAHQCCEICDISKTNMRMLLQLWQLMHHQIGTIQDGQKSKLSIAKHLHKKEEKWACVKTNLKVNALKTITFTI